MPMGVTAGAFARGIVADALVELEEPLVWGRDWQQAGVINLAGVQLLLPRARFAV